MINLGRLMYGVMYRVGFTPWDGHVLPSRLQSLAAELTKGKALDIGCGTGDTSILLAKHGWEVLAIDFVERALESARKKANAAGVTVRFLRADATRLGSYGVGGGFTLLCDNGCMHGLSDDQRDAYVREVSAVAASGARLLLVAFLPGKRRGPRGINRSEVERCFSPGWELVGSGPEFTSKAGETLHSYELRRR
jgi:ubiquinone/menaquinone biosynthesis C-methylase UbiE